MVVNNRIEKKTNNFLGIIFIVCIKDGKISIGKFIQIFVICAYIAHLIIPRNYYCELLSCFATNHHETYFYDFLHLPTFLLICYYSIFHQQFQWFQICSKAFNLFLITQMLMESMWESITLIYFIRLEDTYY